MFYIIVLLASSMIFKKIYDWKRMYADLDGAIQRIRNRAESEGVNVNVSHPENKDFILLDIEKNHETAVADADICPKNNLLAAIADIELDKFAENVSRIGEIMAEEKLTPYGPSTFDRTLIRFKYLGEQREKYILST